jgi:amidophosphoribosyltransferase
MCGVAWVIALKEYFEHTTSWIPLNDSRRKVAYEAFRVLRNNENRGGQGFWITFLWDEGCWKTDKFIDISSADVRQKIKSIGYHAFAAIGHARYATSSVTGGADLDKNLPFTAEGIIEFDENRDFAYSFNGNIANYSVIRARLEQQWQERDIERKFKYESYDSELLKFMIVDLLESWVTDLRMIVEEINKEIDGCCNLAILNRADGRQIISVDKHGFRPLSYGTKDGLFYYSSEEHSLDSIWVENITRLQAWEYVEIIEGVMYPWKMRLEVTPTPCVLEYIYFSNPLSRLHNNESIQRWRRILWQRMAEIEDLDIEENPDTYVIVWVPDGGTLYAQWYAEFFWKKPLQAILKDQDIWRTFTSSDEERQEKLLKKYLSAFEWKVEWKELILIDDSLVRSSTIRRLIPYIQQTLKPSKIHIRICSPTIKGHCPYALNIQSIDELFAPKYVHDAENVTPEENQKMAEALSVESIRFLPIAYLREEMVRVNVENACNACMTWIYPTPCWQAKHDAQIEKYILS